jgi:hypothetical protein
MGYDKNWAERQISNLGYRDINQVPSGRGNDYLSTLVAIAGGRDFGEIEFNEILAIIKQENDAELGPKHNETKQPRV